MKIVVYLDSLSKRLVKLNNRLLSDDNVAIISDLKKINTLDLDEARYVCCFSGTLQTNEQIKQLKMYKTICNLNYIFYLNDSRSMKMVGNLGKVYQCKVDDVTFELLQAGIYGDMARSVSVEDKNQSYLLATKIIESDRTGDTWKLALDYKQISDLLENTEKKLAQLESDNSALMNQNAVLSESSKHWEEGYRKLFENVLQSNRKLQQYETIFTSDVYQKVNLRRYPNKPTIVYLKVFSEFVGLQTFIETLVDSFKLQRRKSVKVVQLFDSVNDRQIRLLPEYYHRLHGVYTNDEITANDFLFKVGDYSTMMDRLLTNQEGVDVLILIDNKNFDDVVLQGTFLQFNLCRTARQAEIFALPQKYTIINQKINGWNIWVPINTTELDSKEKFIKLSSRKVISKILEISDKFANSY